MILQKFYVFAQILQQLLLQILQEILITNVWALILLFAINTIIWHIYHNQQIYYNITEIL